MKEHPLNSYGYRFSSNFLGGAIRGSKRAGREQFFDQGVKNKIGLASSRSNPDCWSQN